MLDIQFVRDNPDLVAEKSRQKGYQVDVSQLLGFDRERRELLQKVEALRRERNDLNSAAKGQKPDARQVTAGREIKEKLGVAEHQLDAIELEYLELLKQVPNMPLDTVPVGSSETDNRVAKTVGEQPQFDFEPKTHWQIGEAKDWIDKQRAAKVSGSRFAYLKGDLVRLQFAIVQFVFETLADAKTIAKLAAGSNLELPATPFAPILPPAMIKTDVFAAMDRLEPRDDRYQIGEPSDDLWLQGSAEHTIGSMHKDEIIDEAQLPLRLVGYSSSFRREAGNYGKDTEGIFRMHQFDKLEMEVFSAADTGLAEHKLLCSIQEYLVGQLGLSYRVIEKCTADIGKPNAAGIDIDCWLPGQGEYRETHTADYMTDYQARRLKTRVRRSDGQLQLVHSNDATAFALGRIMIAIIENYQTKEGNVKIPDVLKQYMAGRSEI